MKSHLVLSSLQAVRSLHYTYRQPILLIFTGFILIAKAAAVIKERVVGDPDIWKQTFLTWTALQEELQSSQKRGYKRRREEDEEERLTADESTHTLTSSTHLLQKTSEMDKESRHHTPSFRVSCRCSGAIARSYTAQVCVCNFNTLNIQNTCHCILKCCSIKKNLVINRHFKD